MEIPKYTEHPPSELLTAALANDPYDMPVSYAHLAGDHGRAQVVPTHLAHNIGPLLGVPNPDGPFGEACWLSSFNKLTLKEIARGAPEPTREELANRRATPASLTADWEWVGHGVLGTPPNRIVSATMNAYGPDTKSATMLAGINRLLEPQTAAVQGVINGDYFQQLAIIQKLQVFAGLLIGVYRPQPLLIESGLTARSLQRAHMIGTSPLPMSPGLKGRKFARCELPEVERHQGPKQPTDFELIDTTVAHLIPKLPWAARPQLIGAEKIVIDSFFDALTVMSKTAGWRYDVDHETGKHTVHSPADAAEVGPLFMAGVLPHMSRKHYGY